jgi:hypothetical protein
MVCCARIYLQLRGFSTLLAKVKTFVRELPRLEKVGAKT